MVSFFLFGDPWRANPRDWALMMGRFLFQFTKPDVKNQTVCAMIDGYLTKRLQKPLVGLLEAHFWVTFFQCPNADPTKP